ncbi:putative membrane protein YfcA [Bosea sp. BE271]|nr:putative membrane protein YfcA [Bosea robiniae]MDR6898049.1 putative membrane protein YfcA [Bosea sp. BE109]MDR7141444.1 putative membrane protein YfcA [Bosea sp. BE168]MDR7178108.1 putative membrane protein YfcA [Bosea sp. BE271]
MCALTAATALAKGGASGFFGIGGGFLIVPALIFAIGWSLLAVALSGWRRP